MDRFIKTALTAAFCTTVILFLLPGSTAAQFEKKLSLNVSAGYFNTVGWDGWDENWWDHGPSLMPNFKGGPAVQAGLQFNFNRHFSLEFLFGYAFSWIWYFDASPENEEPFNYLAWEVLTVSEDSVLQTGDDYMDLSNLCLGLAPRYYFLPANRFNPFIYAGISFNVLNVYYESLELQALQELGREDEYEENYELAHWFEYQAGLGCLAGAGVDITLNESVALFAMASYQFVPLRESSFVNNTFLVNYHHLSIHLGARISFLKSRQL
jgi:hypothetical protein